MINSQPGAELVIIISYSASPSRIIVLVKKHRTLLLLKEKKIERKEKGMKKEMKKWTKELHATK